MISRTGYAAAFMLAAYSALGQTDRMADPAVLSGGSSTSFETGREAYGLPSPAMPAQLDEIFFLGRNLFRQVWVVAPALERDASGLGPLFNRPSCTACHLKNGRGRAPDDPAEKMTTMLVRLSLPGKGPHGGPLPHPVYGDQLNDAANPGVAAEGQARVRWREHVERFADGEEIRLRRPTIEFTELAYGPLGTDILVSARIAPAVFGLGLLEAVPDEFLRAQAAREKPGGVRGRVNEVWDAAEQRMVVGRFGWKANAGSLLQQTAAAFIGDIGVTSPVFPGENCSAAQSACKASPSAATPEIDARRLGAVVLYQQLLAVPARRGIDRPDVQRGEHLFQSAGCATCHLPEVQTGTHPSLPLLSRQRIQPYTDLLVHDMGEGLADGRPDFSAGPADWRTAPLWGIGLSERINGHAAYLHDGRARNLLEAIMWHGGEAESSRESVRRMTADQREALAGFLNSL